MHYINSWPYSMVYTPQHIKSELVRRSTALQNPAVYAVETELTLPLHETILPVARRVFIKYLATQA